MKEQNIFFYVYYKRQIYLKKVSLLLWQTSFVWGVRWDLKPEMAQASGLTGFETKAWKYRQQRI